MYEVRGTYTSTRKGAAAFLERIREDKFIEWIQQITDNGSCVTIVSLQKI